MRGVNCRWVKARLSDPAVPYLLSHERLAIQSHLETCERCRRFEAMARRLSDVAPRLSPPARPPFADRSVVKAALEGRLPDPPGHQHPRFWVPILAGSAALAAVILVLATIRTPTPEQPIVEGRSVPARLAVNETRQIERTGDTAGDETARQQTKGDLGSVIFGDPGKPLILPAGDRLFGESGSKVTVEEISDVLVRVRFSHGRIVADVDASASQRQFIVEAPSLRVEVRGTQFSVSSHPRGEEVRVIEGTVLVEDRTAPGREYLLDTNERFATGEQRSEIASKDEIERDRQLMGIAPVIKPRRKSPVQKAKEAIAQKRLEDAQRHIERVRHGKKDERSKVPGLLARLARAYRQQEHFSLARKTYERLIGEYGESQAGLNAMVALAQLESDGIGDEASAIGHFEEYLKRAPDGYLAEDAWVGLVRAHAKVGRDAHIIDLVGRYLASRPAGSFRGEMMRRRADARAKRGDCAQAVAEYRAVIEQWPGSRQAGAAARGLKRCGAEVTRDTQEHR